MRYRIQSVVFPTESKHMMCKELFYKGDGGYLDRTDGILMLGPGQNCDLMTYLNSCSWAKWHKYTNAEKAIINLDIEGKCELQFVGYTMEYRELVRKDFGTIKKEGAERQLVSFEYPDNEETIIGVEIASIDKCTIYGGYYEAEYSEPLNDVHISIATTTCRKEEYIKKNVQLIKREILDGNDDIKDNLTVHVVDNGRTLSDEDIVGDHVFLHPNPNTGGSGGFARGMIEALHQESAATHVLLMDDDVLVLPESILRTYHLLRMLKMKYKDYFISGAMIRYEKPMMQHEDVGTVEGGGEFIPLKPIGDLTDLHNVVKNDGAYYSAKNQYAAWWYCCIPTTQIKEYGLPLPFFIRCDDSEYSLRCNAKILTMNGICIWHMGFELKYNAAMDTYLQSRNMLIAQAASGILQECDIYADYIKMFKYKVRKFEYGAAKLILDGIEDYLKGPEFIEKCNGEEVLKEKRKDNEKLESLEKQPDIRISGIEEVLWDKPRKLTDKLFFHLTENGHFLSPAFVFKKDKEITTASYGLSVQAQKISRRKEYAAVDPYSESFVMRRIDKKAGKSLISRYHKLDRKYKATHKRVDEQYRNTQFYLTSEEFWKKYLGI